MFILVHNILKNPKFNQSYSKNFSFYISNDSKRNSSKSRIIINLSGNETFTNLNVNLRFQKYRISSILNNLKINAKINRT
jgi:hypothetical protein